MSGLKEKMAREYCDNTGSMYFEYTDASNELIDAYESAWDHQQKTIDNLIAALKLADEMINSACFCIESEYSEPCNSCKYFKSKERKLVEPLLKGE